MSKCIVLDTLTDMKFRLIVAGCNCPTRCLSEYLEKNIETFDNKHSIMFDVTSLYLMTDWKNSL